MNNMEPEFDEADFRDEERFWRKKYGASDEDVSTKELSRNRKVLGVVVLIIAVAVYFGLTFVNQGPESSESLESKITDSSDRTEQILRLGQAAEWQRELVRLEREADSVSEAPAAIKLFNDRINISEKLIQLNDNREAVNRGIIGKLAALSHWQFLNVTRGVTDNATVASLESFASGLKNHPDQSVGDAASVALAVSGLVNYYRHPNKNYFEAARKRFESAAELANDSAEIANALYRSADWLEQKEHTDEALELYRILRNRLKENSGSAVSVVRMAASESMHKILFDFVRLADQIPATDSGQVLSLFESYIRNPEFGFAGYEKAIPLVDTCLSWSRPILAKELLSRIQLNLDDSAISMDEKSKLRESLDRTRARLDSLNKQIVFGDLRPINRRISLDQRNRFALVVYWTPGETQSNSYFEGLEDGAEGLASMNIDVILICDRELNPKQMEFVNKKARTMITANFVVTSNSEKAGDEFIRQFPVPSYPYVLVLGKSNEILLINPTNIAFVQKELERLARQ